MPRARKTAGFGSSSEKALHLTTSFSTQLLPEVIMDSQRGGSLPEEASASSAIHSSGFSNNSFDENPELPKELPKTPTHFSERSQESLPSTSDSEEIPTDELEKMLKARYQLSKERQLEIEHWNQDVANEVEQVEEIKQQAEEFKNKPNLLFNDFFADLEDCIDPKDHTDAEATNHSSDITSVDERLTPNQHLQRRERSLSPRRNERALPKPRSAGTPPSRPPYTR